jgi:tight adherence protein B
MLIVAALLTVATALFFLVVGMRSRRRAMTLEELSQRMGRFASREEMLVVSGGTEGKSRSNVLARRLEDLTQGGSMADRASSLLARADAKLTVGEYLLMRVICAIGGFALGFLFLARSQPALALLIGLATAFVGSIIPSIVLARRAKAREKKFIEQLGDTISLMGNSLRAGYSLLQTMEMVSRESEDPIATEFRRVVREIGLGISSEEALENLLRRIPSSDLDLLVTAINIQHEVGGNLAQILAIIGQTIRDRVKIKGEIAVLTAQQQISGYVISALPIFLAGGITLMSPSYMAPMFEWPWLCMPIASVVMMILGFFAMKKITAIEV